MHGDGGRRKCPECDSDLTGRTDYIPARELRGPRNITGSNIDRVFDNRGRFLFIEEKRDGEGMMEGQKRMLHSLARMGTVWVVTGTPAALIVHRFLPRDVVWLGAGDFDFYQGLVDEWFGHNP